MTDSIVILFQEVSEWQPYRVNILVLCSTPEQRADWEKWKKEYIPPLHFSILDNHFSLCDMTYYDLILEIGDWMHPDICKDIKDYKIMKEKFATMEVVCEV